jgi:hypothetical protein
VVGVVMLGAAAVGVRKEVAAWGEVVDLIGAVLASKAAADAEGQASAAEVSAAGDREAGDRAAAPTANGLVVE